MEDIKIPINQAFPKVMDRFQSKIDFSRKNKPKETTRNPVVPPKQEKTTTKGEMEQEGKSVNIEEIKKENSNKINSMTIEEIKQAQKEILNLDPGLLEKLQFLAGKTKKEDNNTNNTNENLKIENNEKQVKKEIKINDKNIDVPVKNKSSKDDKSHFKKIEKYFSESENKRNLRRDLVQRDKEWSLGEVDLKKMEWMSKGQEKPKSLLWNITEEELISLVRFGFDGEILPLNQELPKGKSREALHHHGDDQENPGKILLFYFFVLFLSNFL